MPNDKIISFIDEKITLHGSTHNLHMHILPRGIYYTVNEEVAKDLIIKYNKLLLIDEVINHLNAEKTKIENE